MDSLIPLFIAINLAIWPTSSAVCSNTNPCPLKGGRLLPRCPELVSENGYLEIFLSVEIGIFKFEWLELPRRSYNGSKCPVTWRVKPGDTVQVTLINNLGANADEQNITNLHTHGLHISPKEPQDNPFVSVKPGESYQYTYKIGENHAPGTHWYHPHYHGSKTLQITGGMAGILIVEDDPSNTPTELRAVSCPENCKHDISLIVSPMLLMAQASYYHGLMHDNLRDNYTRISGGGTLEDWLNNHVNNFTVNGEFNPTIILQQDQLTRFRILNVGDLIPLELNVIDEGGNPAPCDIREIARDGVYFDVPLIPKLEQSVLYPANRLDWLIKCGDIGTYKLFSNRRKENEKSFAGSRLTFSVIATIQVTERTTNSSTANFPKTLPARPEYLKDLRNEHPEQVITVEIGGNNELNREHFSTQDNYRFKVEADSVVEIQMISADYDFSHALHFHINHVQVIGFQPYAGPIAYYLYRHPTWEMRDQETGDLCYYQHKGYKKGDLPFNVTDPLKYKGHYERWKKAGEDTLPYPSAGQWMDTFFAPGLANITLRMKTDQYTGPMLVHCHLPSDSDMGMMMVIEIVEKGGNTSGANIISGNAAPGSCKKCDWNRYRDAPPECIFEISDRHERIVYFIVVGSIIVLMAAVASLVKFSSRSTM